jgi:dipeptide transport system ATP-binding protein
MPLLDIAGLTVKFGTDADPFVAVDDVDLAIDESEVVGIVGESDPVRL